MMNRLHAALNKKLRWYNRWHAHRRYARVHWVVFVATAMLSVANVDSELKQQKMELQDISGAPVARGIAVFKHPGIVRLSGEHILVLFKPTVGAQMRSAVLAEQHLEEKRGDTRMG